MKNTDFVIHQKLLKFPEIYKLVMPTETSQSNSEYMNKTLNEEQEYSNLDVSRLDDEDKPSL